jgi:hypothetical protein
MRRKRPDLTGCWVEEWCAAGPERLREREERKGRRAEDVTGDLHELACGGISGASSGRLLLSSWCASLHCER